MSGKSSFGKKEAKDIFFAVEHLRTTGRISPYKLAIWGGGAGASIALKTMDMFPYLFRLGIVVYPYSNITHLVKNIHQTKKAMIEHWTGKSRYLHLKSIRTPILFFQGKLDKIVDPQDSKSLFEKFNKCDTSVYTEWSDESHSLVLEHNKKDYYQLVEQSLERVFKGQNDFTDFSSEVYLSHSKLKRAVFKIMAVVCLVLGIIGAFLPVMPTVVFLLLAAVFYSYSSRTSYNKLMNSKLFGSALRSWYETRCIHSQTKIAAIATIIATFAISSKYFVRSTGIRAAMIMTAIVLITFLVRLKNYNSLYKD